VIVINHLETRVEARLAMLVMKPAILHVTVLMVMMMMMLKDERTTTTMKASQMRIKTKELLLICQ
jgi:hypothetical protein